MCGLVAGCATTRVRPAVARASVSSVPRAATIVAPTPPAVATPAPPPSPFADLPGWSDDTMADVLPAWRRTCERLSRAPSDRPVGRAHPLGTVADWRATCDALPSQDADHASVRRYFEERFTPSLVTFEGTSTGLFTGYYEPELRGARRRHGRFTVPLYERPRDLADGHRIVRGRRRRYWTRAQIAAGALRGTARPIVWVDDAADAFFLEIQGSGRVVLEDGTTIQLNYSASNGHPYVALGRVLIDRGAIERSAVSLQSIRAWLLAHPREAQSVMNHNPSYVFFRESNDGGSHGAEGVVLTPGRSMAVDPQFVALGVPLFLDVAALEGVGPIRRLVVAQDTGGAIRGAIRGDLFWGPGPDAYDRAGRMRQSGRYWMLVPRSLAQRPSP
jgi:membrane-bound lytic murein transglycosylase A